MQKRQNTRRCADATIHAVFEEERNFLIKTARRFDACMAQKVRGGPQCLASFDRYRYRVPCAYANKTVQRRVYAERVCFYAHGRLIADHLRVFGRDRTQCDPLHYLPVLERKPGALRNGRPFREWAFPLGLLGLRDALERTPDGGKQLAGILAAIPQYGEEAVNIACELALEAGLTSKDKIGRDDHCIVQFRAPWLGSFAESHDDGVVDLAALLERPVQNHLPEDASHGCLGHVMAVS